MILVNEYNNKSLNQHNEPAVCLFLDALQTFLRHFYRNIECQSCHRKLTQSGMITVTLIWLTFSPPASLSKQRKRKRKHLSPSLF